MSQEDFEDVESENEIEDHSGESLCETCKDRTICEAREDSDDPWIFEDQYLHCHEIKGAADYQPNEVWIDAAVAEGII
jgi:hypothetical protein